MDHMMIDRANGRAANQMRTVHLTRDVMTHALGSCLVEFGDTKVLCAATIEEGVPGWRKASHQGWVTAEYAMLPASTNRRTRRETNNRKGRAREIERRIGVMTHALGSCLVEFGDTKVLCAATIEEGVPGWRKASHQGWVTAEYAMLPASTNRRTRRETNNRKGRAREIERRIGRRVRPVVNLKARGEHPGTGECEVTQAVGGTRMAGPVRRVTPAHGLPCTTHSWPGSRPARSPACRGRARSRPSPWVWWTVASCSTLTTPRTATPRWT